jgi:hypothetical protein
MMENIGEVLKASGLTFDDVFKCTAMLADRMGPRTDHRAANVRQARTGPDGRVRPQAARQRPPVIFNQPITSERMPTRA